MKKTLENFENLVTCNWRYAPFMSHVSNVTFKSVSWRSAYEIRLFDQTWHFLTLANRPNFWTCLFYLIMYKKCILSFGNFYPLPFLWLFKCSKKNIRTWKQEKKTKIFVFQPILDCFTIMESLEWNAKHAHFLNQRAICYQRVPCCSLDLP
jgi:hypothetical protein